MRIAVLVYGRLARCVEHYENTIQSIGTEHAVDFFASSDNSENIDEFVKTYKPVSYTNDRIEYTCDMGKYPMPHLVWIDNMTRHFINKSRVLALLEKHDAKYDVVISLRIDCVFNNKFNFDDIKENTIYIPDGGNWCGGINDQIAYGKMEVMKMYNSIFPNALVLLDKGLSVAHPENLTLANIRYHNLEIARVPLSYSIQR